MSRSGHCANRSSASGTASQAKAAHARSSADASIGANPRKREGSTTSLESHAMRTPTIAADPGASQVGSERSAHAAPLWQGLALAMAGSIAFSGKAIIVKLAYRYGVDAVTLIMYRMLFALPLFGLLAWWAGRGRPALTRRDWLVCTGLGFSGYYLSSFLDFAGLAYITAGLERLILYLNPTLVLALGAIVFKRRVRSRQLIA